MKRRSALFIALALVIAVSSAVCAADSDVSRYIVRFKSEATKLQNLSHAKVIKVLQSNLKKNIKNLFKTFKAQNEDVNSLWIANAIALNASKSEIARIAKLPAVAEVFKNEYKIYIDKDLHKGAVMKESPAVIQWGVQRVNAPEVWQSFKIDGAGVVVGVIDTGVDGAHEVLKNKVIAFKDFTHEASSVPVDGQGHGTHVCGTIAGSNGVGVAPGARLVVGRVFDSQGGTTTEALLSAMQWVADPDGVAETNDAPKLINNSWGSDDSTSTTFWVAVENWVNAGILPVFAAGNNGMWGGKVGTPAAYPQSWAVAATTNTDNLSYFSSQGPIFWNGEEVQKPNIAAPGSDIISCAVGGGLVSMSGTSMACPHTAGVAALAYQADPSLSIEQIRLIAGDTSKDLGAEGPDTKFGDGLINSYKLVEKIIQNCGLASAFAAYESALTAEQALVGIQAVSPLAEPVAKSIIERAKGLDEGQFRAMCISVEETGGEASKQLLKDVLAARTAEAIYK